MRARTLLAVFGAAFLSASLLGCSFSASASLNTEGKAVLKGKDKIVITAAQPAAPEEPPPPPPPVKKARLVGKKIEILEKVMFDYNKATIKRESHELLNDVASVIKENPTITKISIEGHTDSDGSDKYNKKLSQKRADSVKEFLAKAGIDANILEAIGYGEERPIADNTTDEGKEKNRRVEFNITGQSAPKSE
jgi:outer membrane protein OmpA-like peptidoglycan-associated protein